MKRLLYLLMAALLMVLAVSCKKDKPGNKIPEGAVDLGIVMTREDGTTYKLYWATSNLSKDGLCANPEDYGDYYAWGETEPKLSYSESSYTMDNLSNLTEAGRDVAHVKLDGNWRMPTSEEFQELIDNCTSMWTTQNGVNGRLFTSIKPGYTDKSIFLPAAGLKRDTYSGNNSTNGYYWSSSIVPIQSSDAWLLYCHSDRAEILGNQRYLGYSVRPVYEE